MGRGLSSSSSSSSHLNRVIYIAANQGGGTSLCSGLGSDGILDEEESVKMEEM